MNKTKTLFLTVLTVFAVTTATAQYPGRPTFHDDFAQFYVMGGYQQLQHPSSVYNVGTIQAQILFSFFSSRISLTTGPDYLSFSTFGIVCFAPSILMKTIRGEADNPALLGLLIFAFSAAQWQFPLTNHLEVSFGWDALKFTKLKNLNDTFYCTGSLNAGLTYFIGDHLFVNGYYEFNHTHNPIISLLNKAEVFGYINDQPGELKGHSFGARIGWMF